LEAISKMIGINLLTSDNVFRDIKNSFMDSETPMLSFTNLIRNNLRSNAMDSVNMVTDSVDYGSSIINIKELYKTRSRPDMTYYEDQEIMSDTNIESKMMTVVTARGAEEAVKVAAEVARNSKDIYKVRMSDSEIVAGCKLVNAFITSDDERIKETMVSERVFYTEKTERMEDSILTYHCYTTLHATGIIEVNAAEKKITIGIYMRTELDMRGNKIMTLMLTDILKYYKWN
jgi:hypothetical protein